MQYSTLLTLVLSMAAFSIAIPAPSPIAQLSASTADMDPFSALSGIAIGQPLSRVPTTIYQAAASSTFSDPWATETPVYDPNQLPPRQGGHGPW
jgi:hypothetical protein